MAAGDLILGSFTICATSSPPVAATPDIYTRISPAQIQKANTADIAFPNTAGRELRIIGQQYDAGSSLTLVYGQAGKYTSAIYKSSVANMESFLFGDSSSIKAILCDTTTQIYTLTDRDGSYSGMRLVDFSLLSPITPVNRFNTELFMVLFQATFSRYQVS